MYDIEKVIETLKKRTRVQRLAHHRHHRRTYSDWRHSQFFRHPSTGQMKHQGASLRLPAVLRRSLPSSAPRLAPLPAYGSGCFGLRFAPVLRRSSSHYPCPSLAQKGSTRAAAAPNLHRQKLIVSRQPRSNQPAHRVSGAVRAKTGQRAKTACESLAAQHAGCPARRRGLAANLPHRLNTLPQPARRHRRPDPPPA